MIPPAPAPDLPDVVEVGEIALPQIDRLSTKSVGFRGLPHLFEQSDDSVVEAERGPHTSNDDKIVMPEECHQEHRSLRNMAASL